MADYLCRSPETISEDRAATIDMEFGYYASRFRLAKPDITFTDAETLSILPARSGVTPVLFPKTAAISTRTVRQAVVVQALALAATAGAMQKLKLQARARAISGIACLSTAASPIGIIALMIHVDLAVQFQLLMLQAVLLCGLIGVGPIATLRLELKRIELHHARYADRIAPRVFGRTGGVCYRTSVGLIHTQAAALAREDAGQIIAARRRRLRLLRLLRWTHCRLTGRLPLTSSRSNRPQPLPDA